MGKQRLLSEIKKYVRRYEDELRRSGMEDEQISLTLNKLVSEAYKTGLTDIDSSIKAYNFYNRLEKTKHESQKVLVR